MPNIHRLTSYPLRMEPDVRERLQRLADSEQKTLGEVINELLTAALDKVESCANTGYRKTRARNVTCGGCAASVPGVNSAR